MGGAPGQSNELLIDGSPDTTRNLRVAYNPPPDAVQEIKVETFQSDAAYGHTGGGTVNVVMRGGTNSVHGSVYEFNRNSALASNTYQESAQNKFNIANGDPRNPHDRFNRNQFGYSLGGPAIIDSAPLARSARRPRVRARDPAACPPTRPAARRPPVR